MSRRKSLTPPLTKKRLDSLEYPYEKGSTRSHYVPDHAVERFYVRILPSGAKRFVVRAYVGGAKREIRIGDYGALTLQNAREAAAGVLADLDRGIDPTSVAALPRHGPTDPTFAQYAQRYLADHASRLRSNREVGRLLERHLLPRFGSRLLREISVADVVALRSDLADRPYEGNRARDLLQAMFNVAMRWEVLPHDFRNPARPVERNREAPRERVLSEDEVGRLVEAIEQIDIEHTRVLFLLLVTLPLRRSEVMRATWDGFDAAARVLRVEDLSDHKRSSPQPIPAALAERISALPRYPQNPYIFPSRDRTTHIREIDSVWQDVRRRASVPDARMHDLRRTIATEFALSAGGNEYKVAKFLGHSTTVAARHYVHLATQAESTRSFVEGRSARMLKTT